MKKIFSFLLLFCSLAANAQDQKHYDAYYTNLPVKMQKAALAAFPD